LEEEDAEWSAKKDQKAQPAPSVGGSDTGNTAAETARPEEKPEENKRLKEDPAKPRGPRSARDYGFS